MVVVGGIAVALILVCCCVLAYVAKNVNCWFYERRPVARAPPGDLGWPFIGNMLSFLRAFKSSNPDAFVKGFHSRFGKVGVYKAFMFGEPTAMVTTAAACKTVLGDDGEGFAAGWPRACRELMGPKSFACLPELDHRRLRRATAPTVISPEALRSYFPCIYSTIQASYQTWSQLPRMELLPALRKMTFNVIRYVVVRHESDEEIDAIEREYSAVNLGVRAMAINLPGTAYYTALKARKKLVGYLQGIIDRRRLAMEISKAKQEPAGNEEEDMLAQLLQLKDENGNFLTDEEIIDLLVVYLNAGHESTAHVMMWTIILLEEHPHVFEKAKAEQMEIIKRRPKSQNGLTVSELGEMHYLKQVINEALRLVNISPFVFRQAVRDVDVCGYTIPKGWKTQVWLRNVHLDPEVYPDPYKFDPDRWNDLVVKPGTFVAFGAGIRLCPGNELARMELCVFLHHLLLYYDIKRLNPDCKVKYLPHPKPADNCPVTITKKPSPCN